MVKDNMIQDTITSIILAIYILAVKTEEKSKR